MTCYEAHTSCFIRHMTTGFYAFQKNSTIGKMNVLGDCKLLGGVHYKMHVVSYPPTEFKGST